MRVQSFLGAVVLFAAAVSGSSPRISGISPAAPAPSPFAQNLAVSGAEFMPGLSLDVVSPDGRTQHLRGPEIQAQRDSSFNALVVLAGGGSYTFVVTNADGGTSDPFVLKMKASPDAPVIEGINPTRVPKRTGAQALMVEGKHFATGLVVNLTDPKGMTSTINAPDVGHVTPDGFQVSVMFRLEGEYSLTVTNPDGAISNAIGITVVAGNAR